MPWAQSLPSTNQPTTKSPVLFASTRGAVWRPLLRLIGNCSTSTAPWEPKVRPTISDPNEVDWLPHHHERTVVAHARQPVGRHGPESVMVSTDPLGAPLSLNMRPRTEVWPPPLVADQTTTKSPEDELEISGDEA